MANGMIDFYAELEVPCGADLPAVKKSYRTLVLKYHPDKNPTDREAAEAKIRKINNAYETLGNPAKRAAYDAQARSMFSKANGIRVDTTLIQPRVSIPKAFMLCPMGHPDKFMRSVGRSLSFHARSDVAADGIDFNSFFQAARFSLWWLPEVNNMCRLRTQPVISSGVIGLTQASTLAAGPPSGSILSFGLSPNDPTSDVMLSDLEQPACTNLIAVPSPDFPGAWRFQAAFFPGHFLAFEPPKHTQMTGRVTKFDVVDYFLMDFCVAEKFRTLDEVLIPVIGDLGGDRKPVKLTSLCQDSRVQNYFQTTMGGAFWDFADFASYFHAHSDTWDYDPDKRILRMRGLEDRIGGALKHARTPLEASAAILKKTKEDITWLPFDCIDAGLRMLADAQSLEKGEVSRSQPSGCKDAQIKLLSILKKMCTAREKASLSGLISIWDSLAGFGRSSPDADIRRSREEVMDAVADCLCAIIQTEDLSVDSSLLSALLDMPLNWKKCAEALSQKGQQFIAKQPLEKLLPLIRKAAAAKAGKFGECLATSAMMKLFGAEPTLAVEALDAMVSGGFGIDGVPMMLRMLLSKVPAESSASVVAGLAEHGASGSDFDACWEATVAEGKLDSLPLALRERIYAQRKARARSRSRGRSRK